jgi:hypothetical protein
MTTTHHLAACVLLLACAGTAQNQTVLFTGRFPFVSFGSTNERPGGAISQLAEFDINHVTPGATAIAESLVPSSMLQCYLGDGNNDGNYTKFAGFKTYFENIQIGGLFVKDADRGAVTWDKVFFTVRDNVVGKDIEVVTTGGLPAQTLVPGDWVRMRPNGTFEYFLTAAQLQVAAGAPPTGAISVFGAHALLQTSTGDLYYVPVQGGQWLSHTSPSVFAQDGAICKIDAGSIVYDANGNVASLAPLSARLIIDETQGGPGPQPLTTRQMAANSGAQDRTGAPVVIAGIFGKVCGLAFDPAGGTFTSTYPDANSTFTSEPNLLFCSDAGSYAGTIWSTANLGSVATINGVLCGSTTPGVPANGSWLGVQFDAANFQPSVMGFALVDALGYSPLLLDQNGYGALAGAGSAPTWDLDLKGPAFTPALLVATFGPFTPGGVLASLPLVAFPPVFTGDSHQDVFVAVGGQTLSLAVTDGNGYGTWSFANPNTGGFVGAVFVLQAAAIVGSQLQLSTPTLTQLK